MCVIHVHWRTVNCHQWFAFGWQWEKSLLWKKIKIKQIDYTILNSDLCNNIFLLLFAAWQEQFNFSLEKLISVYFMKKCNEDIIR